MAEIKNIANKLACARDIEINTGKLGCLSIFGTPRHLIALRSGFKIPGNIQFDLAYINELIQKGVAIPLMDATAFEDVSAEDEFYTSPMGVKRLNIKGLPEYSLTFEEGHEFYREVSKLQSYKNYDFIIGDEEDNWLLATSRDGSYRGLIAGHVTPSLTRRKVAGGDPEAKVILVQFLDRLQFDRNYAILHAEQLGFSSSDIMAVNGVNMTFVNDPEDSDTSVDVKVVLRGDNNSIVEGLTSTSDWRVMVDSVSQQGITVSEATPGVYTIGSLSLNTGDNISVELRDSVLNTDIVEEGGALYRSNVLKAKVIP